MSFRVLMFIMLPFLAVVFFSYTLRLPIDGLLLGILVLIPMVMAIFAHYRHIGRLRSQGRFLSARRHLRLWRILLPWEAYQRLVIELLIESGEMEEARKAIEAAEKKGMEAAFVWGLKADLERRIGSTARAIKILEEALEVIPPSLLRAGLLAQQARLLALYRPTQDALREADHSLAAAEEIIAGPPYRYLLDAIKGEIALARGEYRRASALLQENLDALLDSARLSEAKRAQREKPTFFQRLGALFAALTYSQKDEHQHPFFAELALSLARAYQGRNSPEEARQAALLGLELSQQPFTAEPLRSLLAQLPPA
jgi:tetratricopeptide (TPR) repeat protein